MSLKKTLNLKGKNYLFLLFVSWFFISCTSGKNQTDFHSEACSHANPNCSSPQLQIGTNGSEQDQSGVTVGNSGSANTVKTRSIRYGELTYVEFIITISTLNPLVFSKVEMDPGDTAFKTAAGVSEPSCDKGIYVYNKKCALRIQFLPGTVLPQDQTILFYFKTLLGADFIFQAHISPNALLPDLYIPPAQLQFPHLVIYDSEQACTDTQDITITNYSTDTDINYLSFVISGGDSSFSIVPTVTAGYCTTRQTLAFGGASCKLKLCFKPTLAGIAKSTLSLSASDGVVRQYELIGHGDRATANLSTVDFGTQTAGSSTPVSKTIVWTVPTDADSTSLTSCSYSLSGSSKFSIDSNSCGATLLAGSTCSTTLKYTAAASEQSDLGSFNFSCSQRGGQQSLSLSGMSTARPLTANTTQINFGNTLLGRTQSQVITFHNNGASGTLNQFLTSLTSLSGSGITISQNTCTGTLASNADCEVTLTFTPTQNGSVSSSLSASATESTLGQNISSSGTGISIVASSTTSDMGYVKPGKDRPGLEITIENPSTTDTASGCTLDTATLTAQGFAIDEESTCPTNTSLTAGTSCTLHPRFIAPVDEGAKSATLTYSCAIGGAVSVSLKAYSKSDLRLAPLPPTSASALGHLVGVSLEYEFLINNQHASENATNIVATVPSLPTSWTRITATNAATDCSLVTDLVPGAVCGVRLRYAPSATPGSEATGVTTGTLLLSSNGGAADPDDLIYEGSAVKITSSVGSYDFGTVVTGSDFTASTIFVIANPSVLDDATGCAASVSSVSDFAFVNQTCGTTIAAGSSCSFQIKTLSKAASVNLTGSAAITCTVGGRTTLSLAAQYKKPPQIAWAPTSWDYGAQDIAASSTKTFTLSHTGVALDSPARDLVLASSDSHYTVTATTCTGTLAGGANCTATVQFHSATEGVFTSTLSAISATDSLSTTSSLTGTATNILVTPDLSSVDLGVIDLNTTATGPVITLTNTSTLGSALNCNVTAPTNYSVINSTCGSNFSLAAGAQCAFQLQLAGQAVEAIYAGVAQVVCPSGSGGSHNIAVTATVADVPNLTLDTGAGSTAFGSWDIDNGAKTQTFTLINNESFPVTLTSYGLSTGSSSSFTLTGGTCTSTSILTAAGGSCTIQVAFDPSTDTTSSGGESAKIRLQTDIKPGTNMDYPLTGTGSSMTLALDTNTMSFTTREVGQAGSQTLSVLVTNQGTRVANLTFTSLAATPYTKSGTCGGTPLAVGATCTLSLAFAAAAGAADHALSYVINDPNANSKSVTVSVAATTTSAPILKIKDSIANTTYATTIASTDITGSIGNANNIIDLSPSYKEVTFTLSNQGASTASSLVLPSVTSLLTYSSGTTNTMTLLNDTCSSVTLAYNQSCTFKVRYTPTTNSETSTFGFSVAGTSAVSSATTTATVTSIVGASTRSAHITLSASTFDFGPVALSTNTTQVLTLTNTGDQTATGLTYTYGGADSSVFTSSATTCGVTLNGGNATCTVTIQLNAAVAGSFSGTLSLAGDQSGDTASATLRGATFENGVTADTADYEGYEGDMAFDGTRYFLISRYLSDNLNIYYEPLLTICNKNSKGSVDLTSCTKTLIGTTLGYGTTYNLAGSTVGSGPRVAVSGNKIIMLLQNQDITHGGNALGGNATIVICQKPSVGVNTVSQCEPFQVHTSVSLTGAGSFGSLAVTSSRIALSNQGISGDSSLVFVACNYTNSTTSTDSTTLDSGSCQKTKIGSDNNEGNHSHLYFDGTNAFMASYNNGSGNESLMAVVCTFNSTTNAATCGSLTTVDADTAPSALLPGSYPTLYYDNGKIFVSYQYGSNSNIQLRMADCTVSGTTISACSKQFVSTSAGTGSSPRMSVSGNSTSGKLWLTGCHLSNAASNSNTCKLQVYKCDLASGSVTCSTTPYYEQSAFLGKGVIYSRSTYFESSSKTLIVPFSYKVTGVIYQNGILNLGLTPEL